MNHFPPGSCNLQMQKTVDHLFGWRRPGTSLVSLYTTGRISFGKRQLAIEEEVKSRGKQLSRPIAD